MTPDIEILLASLTLDMKLAQLTGEGSANSMIKDGKFDPEAAKRQYPNGIGVIMVPLDMDPEDIGSWVRDMCECFAELSPVPPMVMCESLHGVLGKGSTVFPQSIGMGATFDPELMLKVGTAIGREAKAFGVRMSLAPDLDLGREPRWGRIEETFGESTHLTGRMGEAYVTGLLADDGKYTSVIKHFTAHGSPEGGVNIAPVNVTPQQLEDKFLPPFKKAIDAGARGVMPAYSALNGVPCHINTVIMKDILRDRWGFDGVVLSDFGGMNMVHSFQYSTESDEETALLAMDCGMDFQVPPIRSADGWKKLLADGRISQDVIDNAVRRILKLKADMGLFNLPVPDAENIKNTVHSDAHRALAREAALKSIVLMKNDGVLPLKPGKKLAVVGPNAFTAQLGDYALPRLWATTPAEALAERAEKDGGCVVCAKGCEVCGYDTTGFEEAEKAAEGADAIVCIIGGKSMKGYGVGWGSEEESILTCGEGCDMHDLTPGGPQLDLVRRMIATGKPVVVVMIDGRPETLFDVADNCSALVAAWYPGEEGSEALSSLLFGDANFSGKLPVTFPRHVGQLPLYHDRVPSACGFYKSSGTPEKPGRDYVFGRTDEAFSFGFGLGYSEIAYTALSAERVEGGLRVAVTLENRGTFDAEEPVLVFIRDEFASVPQPVKKLAAIGRVSLSAGESRTVELTVDEEELMFTNAGMRRVLEPGWFTVMTGSLSERVYVK